MKYLFCLLILFCSIQGQTAEPVSFPNANMFSLSSEEMVFASKLSDSNRRLFSYKFSVKERHLAMQNSEGDLSPDQRVDQIFSSLYAQLEPKAHTR
jgi:hypothetical protein